MLLRSLLFLSHILRLTSAQPQAGPSTNTTNGPLLLPSGSVRTSLDAGNTGGTIGGASAAVVGVIVIALAFAMLRRSRRQTCLYHIEELEGVVPSLPYRKQNADVETASVDSSESDLQLQLPAPALLRAASHKTDAVATMREMHIEEPPIHSLSTSATTRPPLADHSSP